LLTRATAVLISFSFFGIGGDSVNFDNQKPGRMAMYWTATATSPRSAATSHWEVRQDATAPSRPNVFQQLSTGLADTDFPLAIYDKAICRDGDLSVKFKIATGPRRIKEAGMVWRYQDQRNYYLLRFSVDEKNVALFRVQDGRMRPSPAAKQHDFKPGEWYVAKVVYRGPNVRVFVGNRQVFDATDDGLSNPGKTGLWTRGDTITSFDDFRIEKKG
jgi:Domain of Unknown Function (DUF1080)